MVSAVPLSPSLLNAMHEDVGNGESAVCLGLVRKGGRTNDPSHAEPTSALDAVSAALVEATLLTPDRQGRRQACIWVTHSDEQAKRVADATLVIGKRVENGGARGE